MAVESISTYRTTRGHEPTLSEAMGEIFALRDHARWTAQTVHQAHHADICPDGTWDVCPRVTCLAAARVLGEVR